MNMDQINEMKDAIKKEGNFKSQTYKGVKYEIVRHEHLGHLCGYLHYTPKDDEERNIIESNFHGGITYENDGVIGFDCAHASDLSLSKIELDKELGFDMPKFLNPKYRTMQYVEDILKSTIDKIVVSKNEEPEMSYQWDFSKLEEIKREQEKEAKMKTITQYAEMLYNGGFTVLSDERVRELRTKEQALHKLSAGMVSLCEEVLDVIDRD